jgi:DNA-binding MarR family transcriptional regulator
MAAGKFADSLWINLENTLRNLDSMYAQAFAGLNLAVLEAYIVRALYEQDGQRASDLARAVGRPPTSFTPILDSLERKQLIERRYDSKDRRAIRVHLTEKGNGLRQQVENTFQQLENNIQKHVAPKQLQVFREFLQQLQGLEVNAENSPGWQMETVSATRTRRKMRVKQH